MVALIVPETSSAVVGFIVPMPTFPDESMSIDWPVVLLNTKTLDPGVIPVAVGGIAWMLPTTVKFAKRLLHIRPVRDCEFYSSGWHGPCDVHWICNGIWKVPEGLAVDGPFVLFFNRQW